MSRRDSDDVHVQVHVHATAIAAVLGTLFGCLSVAVATRSAQPTDDALRRRQPHPRRGLPRRVAKQVKVAVRPPLQLPLAAAVSIALRRAHVRGADAVFAAAAATFGLDKPCKRVVRRRRPPGYQGNEEEQSFPSGHTASTAALAFTLAELLGPADARRGWEARLAAIAATLFVGETRLLLDEHWPTDVLAGALLGSAAAYGAVAVIVPRAQRRR